MTEPYALTTASRKRRESIPAGSTAASMRLRFLSAIVKHLAAFAMIQRGKLSCQV